MAKILFIEDDPDDVLLLQLACKQADLNDTAFAGNGQEGMDSLQNDLASGHDLPSLIFLDLNMPLVNGFEFIEMVRKEPKLSHIPLVVLSTSTNPRDIRKVYQSGGNAYASKPATVHELAEFLAAAARFWLQFVRLAAEE